MKLPEKHARINTIIQEIFLLDLLSYDLYH